MIAQKLLSRKRNTLYFKEEKKRAIEKIPAQQ
jgi:hypothetical protein